MLWWSIENDCAILIRGHGCTRPGEVIGTCRNLRGKCSSKGPRAGCHAKPANLAGAVPARANTPMTKHCAESSFWLDDGEPDMFKSHPNSRFGLADVEQVSFT